MSPEERQQNYRELVHRSNTELKKMPYADRLAMQQKVNGALAPKQSAVPAFLRRLGATHNWRITERELMYKTGDPHPTLNLLAFVEYDPETKRPVWTSVYGDKAAPYRLAKWNERQRLASKSGENHSDGTEWHPPLFRRGSQQCAD
jgi:hypothetical protein